ncbi:MAG: 2OG-Fe(II) oxygenase [Proteobacteria bacterium]|nr:2OG-Fe(II) oxygenase [Pseudomonadota bacterium]
MNSILNQIVSDIDSDGYSITQGFFNEGALEELRLRCDVGLAEGYFKEAGIGTGSRYQVQEKIRADQIWWFSQNDGATTADIFLQFDQLKDHLNQKLYLGLFDFESHLARYKPGAGYERHYDRPKGSARRKLTVTLYLNKDWSIKDGGCLRLYLTPNCEIFVDVEPQFGTLVFFERIICSRGFSKQ